MEIFYIGIMNNSNYKYQLNLAHPHNHNGMCLVVAVALVMCLVSCGQGVGPLLHGYEDDIVYSRRGIVNIGILYNTQKFRSVATFIKPGFKNVFYTI